ncbi:hypothetical protein ACWDUD_05115 [Rhodococcus sp. NPDC003382]
MQARDHAVAVEDVLDRVAGDVEASRSDAVEGAAQPVGDAAGDLVDGVVVFVVQGIPRGAAERCGAVVDPGTR